MFAECRGGSAVGTSHSDRTRALLFKGTALLEKYVYGVHRLLICSRISGGECVCALQRYKIRRCYVWRACRQEYAMDTV